MSVFILFLLLNTDLRGIWIPRWSISDYDRILTQLDGRFNHIFLQIYALGEAYYPSKYAPSKLHSDQWLKNFIKKAHNHNIKVSAWVNLFYSWGYAPRPNNQFHPINYRPEWYVEDITGRSIIDYRIEELRKIGLEGYYLAPAHPIMQAYLIDIILEIIENYDFDGVHLDYVRYPNHTFIYDPYLRSKFMRQYYIDPREVITNKELEMRYSIWGCEDLQRKWHNFIISDLTTFIKTLSQTVKNKNPGILLSAAVKPDYISARHDFYQDWLTWLNAGYVDFVCLMSYTKHIKYYFNNIKKVVKDPGRVAFGLGLYLLKPEDIKKQVRLVKEQPFAGVVFFSYDQLKENKAYINALR